MPLDRAKTMPAPRAGVTSRMAGTAKRAKAARSAGSAAKRQKAAVKKANTAAYKAATRAVMDLKEEKYFNSVGDLKTYPQVPTAGAKMVSVASFATTSNLDPDGNVMSYCGHNIVKLDMLNPFKSTANTLLAPNALDGKHAAPSSSQIGWSINRNYNWIDQAGSGAHPGAINIPDMVECLPVRCRMIRVTPKLAAGVTTQITPDTDLFLNQHGEPYSALYNSFSYSDAEFAQVNTRIYDLLQDEKFTLNAPLIANWRDGGDAQYTWTQVPTIPNAPSAKKCVTNHQLTLKKGGTVIYDQPDAATTVNATSGSRREYIFFHFWYESGENGTQPVLASSGIVPFQDVIKIHIRPESRFKDV